MNMQSYLANLVISQLKGEKPMNIPENLDIHEILDIANRNHMIYMILGALIKTENIPEELLDPLRYHVQKCIITTLMQVTELNKLVDTFETDGIMNQPMKGSCLKFMYPNPEMREMSDIDILISEDKMDLAGKILLEQGYTLSQSVKHHDIYYK